MSAPSMRCRPSESLAQSAIAQDSGKEGKVLAEDSGTGEGGGGGAKRVQRYEPVQVRP